MHLCYFSRRGCDSRAEREAHCRSPMHQRPMVSAVGHRRGEQVRHGGQGVYLVGRLLPRVRLGRAVARSPRLSALVRPVGEAYHVEDSGPAALNHGPDRASESAGLVVVWG